MGIEFQFGKMKVLEMDGRDGCITVRIYFFGSHCEACGS